VSSPFGGSRRADGRDPELAEASRRRERAFARDIGDEQALARDDQPRYRRPRMWLFVLLVVIALVGGYRAVKHSGGGPQITKSCTTPALALAHASVHRGDSVEWSGTGPAAGTYILVFDGTPTQVDSNGNVTVSGGSRGIGPFAMDKCIARSSVKAPHSAGSHTLRLFHRTNGGFLLVAHIALKVT